MNRTDPFGLCCDDFSPLERVREEATAKFGADHPAVAMAAAGVAVAGTGGVMAVLGSLPGAATPVLPVIPAAMDKLNELADKFGSTGAAIANRALTEGVRMIDNLERNAGNVNVNMPRPDNVSGFIRVTLDPTQSRIISAGLQTVNMIRNGIASGRFTILP